MGCRCKTLLPIAGTPLMPRHNTQEETWALVRAKEQQRLYYNRNAKPLPLITPGETIRMQLPREKCWSKGTRAQKLGNCRYQVKVGSCKDRRNRWDLLRLIRSLLSTLLKWMSLFVLMIIAWWQPLQLRPVIFHRQIPTLMGLESPVAAGTVECFCFSLFLMLRFWWCCITDSIKGKMRQNYPMRDILCVHVISLCDCNLIELCKKGLRVGMLLSLLRAGLLAIIPHAWMASESIAHEADGHMGYSLRGH